MFTFALQPKCFYGHVEFSFDKYAKICSLEVRNFCWIPEKNMQFFKILFFPKCFSEHVKCTLPRLFWQLCRKIFSQSPVFCLQADNFSIDSRFVIKTWKLNYFLSIWPKLSFYRSFISTYMAPNCLNFAKAARQGSLFLYTSFLLWSDFFWCFYCERNLKLEVILSIWTRFFSYCESLVSSWRASNCSNFAQAWNGVFFHDTNFW